MHCACSRSTPWKPPNPAIPGMPMGMADIAEVLWRHYLKHNPADPHWPDRDRFVLSNGHGSMLLYALLHLTGYDLPIEELKHFRQLHSKPPGHPEVGVTPGVETTTGPLGQGLANAVGMALAEQLLAAEFNRPAMTIVDHRTFVFVRRRLPDGRHLPRGLLPRRHARPGQADRRLRRQRHFSIDGHVEHWFADDTATRFEAYGWRVIRDVDGHDSAAIEAALEALRPPAAGRRSSAARPSSARAPPQGRHARCARRGARRGRSRRDPRGARLDLPPFEVPADDPCRLGRARARRASARPNGRARFAAYARAFPAAGGRIRPRVSPARCRPISQRTPTQAIAAAVAAKPVDCFAQGLAECDRRVAPLLPEFLGGSADLTGSNLTDWKA